MSWGDSDVVILECISDSHQCISCSTEVKLSDFFHLVET